MISKYGIFCEVVEKGSFVKAAEYIGYTQGAISQTVKALEQELGTTLINRTRHEFGLTQDGEAYYPYISAIRNAEKALDDKHNEMLHLESSIIRIGTWTSVSRTILPDILQQFKQEYPHVRFELKQGDYTSVERWIRDGSIEIGFINSDITKDLPHTDLYTDEMVAILPAAHPLAEKDPLEMQDLAGESLILLDEGDYSTPMALFHSLGIAPQIEYKVYDDYSIMAMVRRGIAISMVFRKVTEGNEAGLAICSIRETPSRTVALAWKNDLTLSNAARSLSKHIIAKTKQPSSS